MATEPGTQTRTSDLTITRIFNAPRELVWKAWSEPEHMKQWWGPKGFTAPVINIDFRVGGTCHACMRSPEGEDFWSIGTYRVIEEPRKIVTTDSFADEKGNIIPASAYGMDGDWPEELLVTILLEEETGGKTKMTLTHSNLPEGEMREMTEAGWKQSFDKMDESLATK